jgi:hypothetical protein
MFQWKVFRVAGACLLVASVGINVLQAQRIRELTDPVPSSARAIGRKLTSLTAVDRNGARVERRLDDGMPTLLYHFSSTCSWCERNWANVEALARNATGRYRVVAVTMESDIPRWLSASVTTVDLLRGLEPSEARALSLGGTPHSLIVGGDGVVTHDWAGAYTKRLERQVEETFGIDLPGLAPLRAQ